MSTSLTGPSATAPSGAAETASAQDPIAKSRGRAYWPYSIALAVGVLVLAEISARNEWVSNLILPAPSDVARALVDGFSSGLFWPHISSTVLGTLTGFGISAVLALTIAGALASIPALERVLLPFIVSFQTLPKIAVAPLMILWLGFGSSGKVAVVVIVCFFPILVNSLQGLKIRDRDRYELFKSLGASRWLLFRYLRLPTAIPYIFAGFHLGIIFALIGAVTSEFVGSRAGLGYVLLQNKAAFNVPGVFSILFLFMVVGLFMDGIMRLIEARFSHWATDVSAGAS